MIQKELIIDKDFLDTFFITYDESESMHIDFRRFLKNVRNFNLIINLSNNDEFEKMILENPLFDLLIDTKSFELLPQQDLFGENILLDECAFKMYFADNEKKEGIKLIEEYGYEVITNQNLKEKWKIYDQSRIDKKRKVTKDQTFPSTLKFDSWEVLGQYRHPLNSILIFDKFILQDKGHQMIKDNLIPLLEILINGIKSNAQVEITIISQEFKKDIESDYRNLENILNKAIKREIRLNLVLHSKEGYPTNLNGLHSRRIFTNYFVIKSDDSFNYFKPNGSINNAAEIEFSFIFDHSEWEFTKKDLEDLSKYFSKIKRLTEQSASLTTFYYPTSECKLLLH